MAVKKTGESKVKKVVGGIAVALALILLGGVCGGLLQHHYKWGEEPKVEEPGGEEKPGEDSSGGGEVSTEAGVSHGIRLAAVKLASSEYEAYGVSAQAESAYTLTATITPSDAANKAVDWTIAFKNASSEWASGKTVTEYATVTPSADGALTAVVENVAAFGEQIVVKATSRDNAEAYATCTVEYLQRTTGYTFNLDGKALSENGAENLVQLDFMESKSAAVQISVNKSTVYTRANTDKAEYFKIKPALAFGGVITASGAKSEDLKEYSGGASATLTGFFDKTWGEALHKANNTIKNKLITNISTYTGADAYTVEIYDAEGGKLLETYGLRLDTSKIVTQKGVESIEIDETEIVF